MSQTSTWGKKTPLAGLYAAKLMFSRLDKSKSFQLNHFQLMVDLKGEKRLYAILSQDILVQKIFLSILKKNVKCSGAYININGVYR